MSNAVQTLPLLDAIKEAVTAALGPMTFAYEQAESLQSLPLGTIIPEDVEISLDGQFASLTRPQQTNRFTIVFRFPLPTDRSQPLILVKATQIDAIIAQLQSSAEFAEIGILPLVDRVSFKSVEPTPEGAYDFELGFNVITIADHH